MWFTRLRLDESYPDIADRITSLNGPEIADDFLNVNLGALLTDLAALSASDAAELWAFLDSATTVIGYATSTDGRDWTVVDNEVLTGGSSLHNGVGAPCVIYDEAATTYKMWYTRFETDWTTAPQLAAILDDLDDPTPSVQQAAVEDFFEQTRSVIGYATSPDGVAWTVQNNQVLPATDGTILDSVGVPCVIQESDTDYKMWYTGVRSEFATPVDIATALLNDPGNFDLAAALDMLDGTASVIGYATSTDGEAWTDSGEVLPLSGNKPLWESVGDPCVVKANGTYEMWYTKTTTDLVPSGWQDLLDAISALDLSGLWTVLDDTGIPDFLTALFNKDLTDIENLLSNTNSVIDYPVSSDGTTWTVQKEGDITGSSSNLWSSVAAPCVIGDGSDYTMWFTKGIGTLDYQSLFDLIFGSTCTIGQATYPPSGGGGFFPPPPPPPGTTSLSGKVDPDGYFIVDVTASSEDELASVTIPKDTLGLDEWGYPLPRITIVEMEDPPDPPADNSVIGVVYEFGPEGATFDPPVTLTITYDPESLPEGVEEEDLSIAVWDEDAGVWVKLPSVVDTENKAVSAQIDGFSSFAILVAHAPASFEFSNLSITPGEVEIGQAVTISITISNSGDLSGTYQLRLLINSSVVDTRPITLDGGESTTVQFFIARASAGRYTVSVGGYMGTFIVVEEEEEEEPPVVEPPTLEPDIITSSLTATAAVRVGETVTINVLVTNQGEGEGSYEVVLVIDGVVAESRTVTLAGNSEQTVSFTIIAETTGVHTVEVDDLSTIFVVSRQAEVPEEPSHLNWWLIGGIIGGCAVITAAAAIFILRRRMA